MNGGWPLILVVVVVLLVWGVTELNALRARMQALDDEVKRLWQYVRLTVEPAGRQPAVQEPVATPPQREPEASPPPARAAATVAAATVAAAVGAAATATAAAPAAQNVAAETEFPPFRWLREFFTGGNAVVRMGIVILFFGVAFLLRYLAEHSHLPIELRLAGIVLGGVALLVVGWRLRLSRPPYALALQGGGVGVLYLTVFAAMRLYGLLPAAVAFPLLAMVAVLSAVLAIMQDSSWLALLGVAGGFLAPVLASTGEGSHVVLFSYYAILNAGIAGVAWFKAWRPLNIAGFVFTFGIGTVWGVLRYRPELFSSTEPFLLLYFLLYVTIAILFTWRQPVQLLGYIDGTLVFGTPLVVFALQSTLLHDRPMPLAYSAVAMSALYLALAWLLGRRRVPSQALLVEAFIAIGVVLLTLAVPLALNAHWNVAAWALEGTALIWVGCRQQRVLARVAGALLCLGCGLIVATEFDLGSGHAHLPLADYAGVVLTSLASIASACVLYTHRQRLRSFEPPMSTALFWWGLLWWSAGGVSEIARMWPRQALAVTLIVLTLTTQACGEIHRRWGLPSAKSAALLQWPLMFVAAVFAAGRVSHPAAAAGWLGWPLAFLGLYGVMARFEGVARGLLANALNAGVTWLLCALLSWEAAFQINVAIAGSVVWPMTGWVLLPLGFLGLLPRLVTRVPWPFIKNREAYLSLVGVGIALYLCGWSVVANLGSEGDFAPLPYLPLVNPLDLAQGFVLLTLLRYWRFWRAMGSPEFGRIDRRVPTAAWVAVTFLWLNAMLLRTLHQWFGVAYGWDALLESTLVQTSLSIFWTVLAFLVMVFAARRRARIAWLAGAALLGVVIAKLFLVDLSRVGSVERIVSFLGVGLLMLGIGYISPLPPAATRANPP